MEANLPISAKYLGNQLWVDEDGIVWTGRDGAYMELFGDELYVTTNTDQTDISGDKEWTGEHNFENALSIPTIAPSDPQLGKAYVWADDVGYTGGLPTIPIANDTTVGGIKGGGDGYTIDEDGTLNITGMGGESNLSLGTITGTQIPILNDNGTGVILPVASGTTAGLLSSTLFTKLNTGVVTVGTTQLNISGIKQTSAPIAKYNSDSNYRTIENLGSYRSTGSLSANTYIFFSFGSPLAGVYWEVEVELQGTNASTTPTLGVSVARFRFTGYNATAGGTLTTRSVLQTAGSTTAVNSALFLRVASGNNLAVALKVPAMTNPSARIVSIRLVGSVDNTLITNVATSAGIFTFASTTGFTVIQEINNADIPKLLNSESATVKELIVADRLRIPTSPPSSPQLGDIWVQS